MCIHVVCCSELQCIPCTDPCLRLEGRVQRVLSSATSSLPTQERDVRLFHRYMFLLPAKRCSDQEYAFWLTQILKPWPITYQAKLLYLLTAPEDENGMYLCMCAIVQGSREVLMMFTTIKCTMLLCCISYPHTVRVHVKTLNLI